MLSIGSGFFWWFVVFNNYLLFIGYFTLVAFTITKAIYLYLKFFRIREYSGKPTATLFSVARTCSGMPDRNWNASGSWGNARKKGDKQKFLQILTPFYQPFPNASPKFVEKINYAKL